MSLSDDNHIPEDLNSLKKKLNNLMCAIDEVSLKEDSSLSSLPESSSENRFKYLESLHALINDRLINIKLNVRESVLKSLDAFEENLDQSLLSIFKEDYDPNKVKRDTYACFLMEKNFRLRESTITELMTSREEFKTLKNMAFAIMSLFFINLMIQDYLDHGYFINIQTLVWCFSGFDVVITTWVMMFGYSYLVISLVKTIVLMNLNARIWIPIYGIYQFLLFFFAAWVTKYFDLSFGSSVIVSCECFRIQMKIHSYFRIKLLYGWGSNDYKEFIPDFIKEKLGSFASELNIPEVIIEDGEAEVQKFTYFFFSPTLLFRDQYAMRAKSDMRFIVTNAIEFLFGIYYTFILFRIYLQPKFIIIGKENTWNNVLLMAIFQMMLPSFLSLFILFYIVVHSWQNMWAEILRFPDRRFYEDWWNSINMREFFRKFIMLIHEWLYTHVYVDLMRFSAGKISRKMSQFITFVVSCLIHLSVMCFSLGFVEFDQYLIFSFVAYLSFNRGSVKKHEFNILFWIEISIGMTLMMTMYSRDYYRIK